jgi:hypothetical protein
VNEPGISEALTKELLRAMYKLDEPLGRIDEVLSGLEPGESRDKLAAALSDVMSMVLSQLMVPLYRLHPGLGRASEPGPWINEV